MKDLTKLIFCIFAISVVVSCEPESLEERTEIDRLIDPISDDGDQGKVIDDAKGA